MQFPWHKKKEFFSEEEKGQLVAAIQKAEQRTSGEVRIYVESHCRFVDPVDRAKEIFLQLEMHKTKDSNGSLIYVAIKDKQAAVLGDMGIHQKVGQQYWEEEVNRMLLHFKQEKLAQGITQVVNDIGEVLHQHFPYDRETDKNELPDEIVFGK